MIMPYQLWGMRRDMVTCRCMQLTLRIAAFSGYFSTFFVCLSRFSYITGCRVSCCLFFFYFLFFFLKFSMVIWVTSLGRNITIWSFAIKKETTFPRKTDWKRKPFWSLIHQYAPSITTTIKKMPRNSQHKVYIGNPNIKKIISWHIN